MRNEVLSEFINARDDAQVAKEIALECIQNHDWFTKEDWRALADSYTQKKQLHELLAGQIHDSQIELSLDLEDLQN